MEPKIVSHTEWLAARRELLHKEKAFTRQRDVLSRERQQLPWVKVEKNYVFDGPAGPQTLRELFAGRSQLVVYHFMFGPGRSEGCPSCSFVSDHIDASLVHLAAKDVTLVVVSRAPYAEIDAFKRRMGWRFPWLSSFANDFNRDYRVSFTHDDRASGQIEYNFEQRVVPKPADTNQLVEEAHGVSVFATHGPAPEQDAVFHTYSAYARGAEMLIGAYHYLDLVPKGRAEEGLPWPMAWVRHHDRYDTAG